MSVSDSHGSGANAAPFEEMGDDVRDQAEKVLLLHTRQQSEEEVGQDVDDARAEMMKDDKMTIDDAEKIRTEIMVMTILDMFEKMLERQDDKRCKERVRVTFAGKQIRYQTLRSHGKA